MRILIHFFFLIFFLTAHSSHANVKNAQTFIEKLEAFSKKIETNQGQTLRKVDGWGDIEASLDFDQFTRRALGVHWKKLSGEQKVQFRRSLEDLISYAAFPKAKNFSANLPAFKYSKQAGGTVLIQGKYEREKDGDFIVKDFEMKLHYGKNAKIIDATIAGELLSSNIERQITRNLEKKSYDELIAMMKKRSDSLKKKKSSKGEG